MALYQYNTFSKPPLTQKETDSNRNFSTKLYRIISWLILILGLYLFGQGAYMKAKAALSQILINNAWSKTTDTHAIKPWPWADTWPVAQLTIPELGITQYIMVDASGQSLAFGGGLMSGEQSLTQGGHIFLAGHRDSHFTFMKSLKLDSTINLSLRNGSKKTYKVYDIQIMDSNKDTLTNEEDSTLLTLITCYPFESIVAGGPLRYVIHAVEQGNNLSFQSNIKNLN